MREEINNDGFMERYGVKDLTHIRIHTDPRRPIHSGETLCGIEPVLGQTYSRTFLLNNSRNRLARVTCETCILLFFQWKSEQ